jgi:predicted RNase H-like nuclease
MSYAVGLDWIGGKKGWACCRLPVEQGEPASFCKVQAQGMCGVQPVAGAQAVILDAPIGLPSLPRRVGALRGCDYGARRIVGLELCSSVFCVPVEAELAEWRRRRKTGESQRRGHIRGLLPGIDSAQEAVHANPQAIAESHPEVVFALLAGHFLPEAAKKDQEPGVAIRLALLARHRIHLGLGELGSGQHADYIDAAAMALVARAWICGAARVVVDRAGDIVDVPVGRPMGNLMVVVQPASGMPRTRMPDSEFVALLNEGLAEWKQVVGEAS